MVKKCIYVLAIIFSQNLLSQSDSAFVEEKMVKAALTISPSIMLDHGSNNIYLDGDWEYFLDRHISFRGEGLWFIDSQNKTPIVTENSILSFGALYHFNKKRHDIFMGMMPGISFTTLNDQLYKNTTMQVIPNVSLLAGYAFYFFKYAHFFINCRYVGSRYLGAETGAVGLNELIFSGGLGWQIRFKNIKL